MTNKTAKIGFVSVFVLLMAFLTSVDAQETVPRSSQEQLLSMLEDPSLVILDARLAKDYRKSDSRIKRAVRVDPHDVSSWIEKYNKDQKIIVYCS